MKVIHCYIYFLLRQPMENYVYGSGNAWRTQGVFFSYFVAFSETWPVRKENMVALQRAEMSMVRWMCGVKYGWLNYARKICKLCATILQIMRSLLANYAQIMRTFANYAPIMRNDFKDYARTFALFCQLCAPST